VVKPRHRRLRPDLTAAPPPPPIGPWAAQRLAPSAQRGQEPGQLALGGQGSELWHQQDATLSMLCASPHSGSQRQMAHTSARAASARVATCPGSESSSSRVSRAWLG